MNKIQFQEIVKKHQPPKRRVRNGSLAFLAGGVMGLLAHTFYIISLELLHFTEVESGIISALCVVFITAVLTGFSLYNKISRHAGAGLFIPTSGFANSVVSSTIDAKFEGPIFGIGSRLFYLAGSVITYGFVAGFLYGLVRLVLSMWGVPLI